MVHWQPGMSLAETERQIIEAAVRFHEGNRFRVAEALGVSEKTIRNKLKQYKEMDQKHREQIEDEESNQDATRDWLMGKSDYNPAAKEQSSDEEDDFEDEDYDEDEGEEEIDEDEEDDEALSDEERADDDYVDDEFLNEAAQ